MNKKDIIAFCDSDCNCEDCNWFTQTNINNKN